MDKEKKKTGPQPTLIDWEHVRRMCSIQCTRNEIASVLGISHDTLERAAKREFECTIGTKIKEWSEGGNPSLRRAQWKLAHKNAAMAIFLGKQYLGQKDTYGMKHQGQFIIEAVDFATKQNTIEVKAVDG